MALRGVIVCIIAWLSLDVGHAAPSIGDQKISSRILSNTRSACEPGAILSLTQVNTTAILTALRNQMENKGFQAYIITSSNDHQGEYIPDHDMRREYVSGFTGSAGDAVVTLDSAAVWTDSRYYLQAEDQLDCNWQLVKTGEKDSPSIEHWLTTVLKRGDLVTADPKILTYQEWTVFDKYLSEAGLTLVQSTDNLIDAIWNEALGRPPYVADAPTILPIEYAGESWQSKLSRVRIEMKAIECDAFIVTALDEIAWVLNMRGTDIPFSPFFRAYLVIEESSATIYLPSEKQTNEVRTHLNSEGSNLLTSIKISHYNDFFFRLQSLGARASKILLPDKYSYAMGVSYRIHSLLPPLKVKIGVSPVLKMRDYKNAVETQGMRNAHIRDAVALCQFLQKLEAGVAAGESWDELQGVSVLDDLRSKQIISQGPSFGTISAFGPNSALPHYSPTNVTNRVIDDSSLFMLDSGGQYLDGTTDVTRTLHFGTPTDMQREAYTRLLIGCIQLASVKFPEGKTVQNLEILVRAPLYGLGLDYGHGSTHGIGAYGGVHEAFNSTYHTNFFGSQEPGYYLANNYGMRLENIVTVIDANLPMSGDTTFLAFETVTLVPYQLKLIKTELMSDNEIKWLNEYYVKIRNVVGAEMRRQDLQEVVNWLEENTKPIERESPNTSTTTPPTTTPSGGDLAASRVSVAVWCMVLMTLVLNISTL